MQHVILFNTETDTRTGVGRITSSRRTKYDCRLENVII